VHSIFPSPSGMCENLLIAAAFSLWQLPQVARTEAFFRFDLSVLSCITTWQSLQDRFRDSCVLPAHMVREVFSWQVRQLALRSVTEVFALLLYEIGGSCLLYTSD